MIGCPKCGKKMRLHSGSSGLTYEYKNGKILTESVYVFFCDCGEYVDVLNEGILTKILKRFNVNEKKEEVED